MSTAITTTSQRFKTLLLVALVALSSKAYALNAAVTKTSAYQELSQQASNETFKYPFYFVFAAAADGVDAINLAAFKKVSEPFPQPAVAYDRDNQFGEWIKPMKSSCLNTRGVVLQRDSKVGIGVNEKCTVTSGNWYDPYTDKTYNDADDIQIDHVVALKNAYMTGAHAWNKSKRCLYANFLGNNFHLLAVNGPENMKKSDKSPLEYVPPNREYVCEYLRNWLQIKFIWDLKMTPREVTAIQNQIAENKCTQQELTISMHDVREQRSFMEANKNLCQ